MDGVVDRSRERLLGALREHGRDAVSFQALESGVVVFDDPLGVVPYTDTGTAWLAVGSPPCADARVSELANRFVDAARRAGRRAAFVGVEDLRPFAGHRALPLGEQPVHEPSRWAETLAAKKSLREQLRRARAKGVTVRRVGTDELVAGSALRIRVRELAEAWLASRRIEPLQFLVAVEPFHAIDDHRYFVAERHGEILAFASAIPIPAKRGFMLEDVLRDDSAPNGTVDLLFDAVVRDAADSTSVTLGLAPLTGPVPAWLRLLRYATRPLFDFEGLRAFKARLLPSRWDPVYLVVPEGQSAVAAVIECLRAFAGGSLIRFGVLSIVRHPSGPPWALMIPLVAWIVLRVLVAIAGQSATFGSDAPTILAWSALDVALALALFRAAMRPRSRKLALATAIAVAVAIRSAFHVVDVGLGTSAREVVLRSILLLAPILGTALLGLSTLRRRSLERGDHPPIALPHV